MGKQRKSKALADCKSFYKLLLYEASGGNLGTPPKKKAELETVTFVEKNRLLAEMAKIATMETKELEEQPEVSGLDLLRKGLANERRESTGGGNFGGATENTADEPADSSDADGLSTEP